MRLDETYDASEKLIIAPLFLIYGLIEAVDSFLTYQSPTINRLCYDAEFWLIIMVMSNVKDKNKISLLRGLSVMHQLIK